MTKTYYIYSCVDEATENSLCKKFAMLSENEIQEAYDQEFITKNDEVIHEFQANSQQRAREKFNKFLKKGKV